MNNEELEKKVKDLFESIIDKLIELYDKHKESEIKILCIIILYNVIDTYHKTPITVNLEDSVIHKWTYLAYTISQMSPKNFHILNNTSKEIITLEDAYENFKDIEKKLKDSDNASKLLEKLRKQNDK